MGSANTLLILVEASRKDNLWYWLWKECGFTAWPGTLCPAKFSDGYQVSLPGYETAIEMPALREKLFGQLLDNYSLLAESYPDTERVRAKLNIGGWVSGNQVYFDLSIRVGDLDTALAMARNWNQQAIYDWATGECIEVVKAEEA